MPIRADLKASYGPDWALVSHRIRFERAKGHCEACGRPHGALVFTLANGGWIDPATGEAWISGATDFIGQTRVSLSTAHVDHDPANRHEYNLRAWCQRCHMLHDAPHHFAQRRITLRSRWALADLFEGPYDLHGERRSSP